MSKYFIREFSIQGLWGRKDYDLEFHDDVNIIIGPNASGKTTLINILFDALNGHLPRLCRTDFSEVVIKLKSFEDQSQEELRFKRSEGNMTIYFGEGERTIPLAPFIEFGDDIDYQQRYLRRLRVRGFDIRVVQKNLRELVPAVWLTVSRRLPIDEEEKREHRRLHREPLESVDECLDRLINLLRQYRQSLNVDLSKLRQGFQRHALENVLYDKQHDEALIGTLLNPDSFKPPSEEDKKALLKAFADVGLSDKRTEEKVEEHFSAAQEITTWIRKNEDYKDKEKGIDMNRLKALFAVPLVHRTKKLVGFAQELEKQREILFSPLHTFEEVVNSFLDKKTVKVSDQGELEIQMRDESESSIEWRNLSSGEKQILILLTQALISEKSPTVYIADEPELSLHVDWQEKLLKALTQLAGKCQFIVATHSPDIASEFGDRIIDLAKFK